MKTIKGIINTGLILILVCTGIFGQEAENEALKKNEEAFNFWIGEWDVYKYNTDTLVGRSSIRSILDGKAIEENYESIKYPFKGISLNKYNLVKDQWEQYWVDNSGLTLHITGNVVDGKMIMGNVMDLGKGNVENRISWYKDTPDTVRQTWDQRNEGETEWKTVFDGSYRMRTEDK